MSGANNGSNTVSGTTGANTGSNTNASTTNIDAGDRSVHRTNLLFIPPVVPGTPPSSVAVGNIVKETSACGPLQTIVREPIRGTYFGWFRNRQLDQGYTEHLAPFHDERGIRQEYRRVPIEDGRGGYRLYGHQVTQYTTVVGVSAARNVALGGGGGNAWGQGGGGSSSSMQQMVTTVQLRDCEIGSYVPPLPPAPIVYVEPKRIRQ